MASNCKKVRVEQFNAESIALVKEVFIQPTSYGISAVFKMKDGTVKYIPMSKRERIPVDIKLLELITLQRDDDGEVTTFFRVHLKKNSKAPAATTESLRGVMSYGIPDEYFIPY